VRFKRGCVGASDARCSARKTARAYALFAAQTETWFPVHAWKVGAVASPFSALMTMVENDEEV
jgi:hypothetical protein